MILVTVFTFQLAHERPQHVRPTIKKQFTVHWPLKDGLLRLVQRGREGVCTPHKKRVKKVKPGTWYSAA